MLYKDENRNGNWYRGETVDPTEAEDWYAEENAATPPIDEAPDAPEAVPDAAPGDAEASPAYFTPAPRQSDNAADAGSAYFTPAPRSGESKKPGKLLRVLGIIGICLLVVAGSVTTVLNGIREFRDSLNDADIRFSGDNRDDGFDFSFSVGTENGEDSDEPEDVMPPDLRDFFKEYYTSSADVNIPKAPTGLGVTLPVWDVTGRELTLPQIYQAVNPAVVGVLCYRDGEEYSWGTGVVFRSDGYIITNTHVLTDADAAEIIFSDDSRYDAQLVGSDAATDIAVLKIEGTDFPFAYFADSSQCVVGESVVAIGNPLGEEYSGTMTRGIISAIGRSMTNNGYPITLLQTDAALNEGNSGGPLINACGQVVGITSMKIMFSYSAAVEGIGFAIPTATIKPVVDSILAYGVVYGQPTLGIVAGSIPTEAKRGYELPDGIYVSEVDERSDAWTQGLREGDIITAAQGTPVTTVNEVNALKTGLAVGDPFTVSVWRDGKEFDITFKLIDKAVITD